MQPRLAVFVPATDRSYPLAAGTRLTVGRTKDCEVHVDDIAVSRRHCALEADGDEVIVTDLESVNGTYLNERAICGARARPGDTIRVGSTLLEIVRSPGRRRGLDSMLSDDDTTISSVIRRRFDPAQFDFVSRLPGAAEAGSANLALLQRAQRHLSMLHRTSEVLATARDIDALADATLGTILDVTGADRAAVVLRRRDPQTGGVEVVAARGRTANLETFTVSRTLIADVIDKGISTFAYDAINDDRFSSGISVVGQRVRSVMCVPLRTTDDILGALYVDSLSGPGRFSEADLELLAALGNQAGVALHRVRLLGELERLLLETIRAIAATIDAKDGYTHRHSERVAALAGRLAAELEWTRADQESAQLAALLHDLGKIAVPDSILNKPTELTQAEIAEMRKHPQHGARILANIQSPVIKAALPGVQYHHERWDGSGYPEGLHGENIPVLGRLLGVADFFDALTSARPYRPALSPDDAVKLIRSQAGTHFDPHIAEALAQLHERGELTAATSGARLVDAHALLETRAPDTP